MPKPSEQGPRLDSIRNALPRFENAPAIVGVGNEMRGDDAFGVLVARGLQGKVQVPLYDTGPVPENYLGKIARSGSKSLVVVDAVDFGGDVGEVRLMEPQEITYSHFSSHLPPLQLMELFVGEGGITMQVVAAQPGTVELMAELSPGMRSVIGAVVEMFEGLYGER